MIAARGWGTVGPIRNPSEIMVAEGVGFEPTLAIKTRTVFKTVSINRSDTPPQRKEMIAQ
jgi:hypothetical protein